MHCLVLEWDDGTVVVNGPYDGAESAAVAAPAVIAHSWPDEPVTVPEGHGTPTWIVGTDPEDAHYVYVLAMGTPEEVAS